MACARTLTGDVLRRAHYTRDARDTRDTLDTRDECPKGWDAPVARKGEKGGPPVPEQGEAAAKGTRGDGRGGKA